MKISAENPLPGCYGEMRTVHYFALGELRESISRECARTSDPAYMETLAQCDEGVQAAQAILMRASDKILDHFTRDRALT